MLLASLLVSLSRQHRHRLHHILRSTSSRPPLIEVISFRTQCRACDYERELVPPSSPLHGFLAFQSRTRRPSPSLPYLPLSVDCNNVPPIPSRSSRRQFVIPTFSKHSTSTLSCFSSWPSFRSLTPFLLLFVQDAAFSPTYSNGSHESLPVVQEWNVSIGNLSRDGTLPSFLVMPGTTAADTNALSLLCVVTDLYLRRLLGSAGKFFPVPALGRPEMVNRGKNRGKADSQLTRTSSVLAFDHCRQRPEDYVSLSSPLDPNWASRGDVCEQGGGEVSTFGLARCTKQPS